MHYCYSHIKHSLIGIQNNVMHPYHRTPNLGYNWETNSGRAFGYYTYGASCSEVEIDCLTGEHVVSYLLLNHRCTFDVQMAWKICQRREMSIIFLNWPK